MTLNGGRMNNKGSPVAVKKGGGASSAVGNPTYETVNAETICSALQQVGEASSAVDSPTYEAGNAETICSALQQVGEASSAVDSPTYEAGNAEKLCSAQLQAGGASSGVNNPTYGAVNVETICSAPQQSEKNDDGSGVYVTMKVPVGLQSPLPSYRSTADVTLSSGSNEAYKELRRHSFALVNRDKNVFVRTRSYQRAEDLLTLHRIVLLRGTPASGKSAIGLSLLHHFTTKGYAPLVMQNCQEWRSHVRRGKKQSILLDCVFGEVRVEQTRYVEWLPFFMDLVAVLRENPNCLVVIILHSHLMAQLNSMTKPHSCFHKIHVVDLDDLPLTSQEKEQMLHKHLATKKIKPDAHAVQEIIRRDCCGPLFPSCCGNYIKDFSRNQYINLRYDQEVFSTPGLMYVEFFCMVLKDPENWKDLVPLLILAMNRSSHVLSHDEHMEMKLRMLGLVTMDVDMEELKMWGELLKGSILTPDMKQFRNMDFRDGFSFALFKHHSMELFLNACDVEFVVKHVHFDPSCRKTDIIIDSSSQFFPNLLQRICQEILYGNIVQMSQYSGFQNDRFLQEFEGFLLQKRCLKPLMLALDHRHKMPLLYWSAWNSSMSLTRWCLKNFPLRDYDGVVRRTFLACSLFGEKVNCPRMAQMFGWLCDNRENLRDAVSTVSLPVPAAEDRLCEEMKTRSQRVLNEPVLLTCGLSGNPVLFQTGGTVSDIHQLLHQRADERDPGSPKPADNVRNSPKKPPRLSSSTDGAPFDQTIINGRGKTPPAANSLADSRVSQQSDLASVVSTTSSSLSGNYMSPRQVSDMLKQAGTLQGPRLTTIAENDMDEEAGEFPSSSEYDNLPSEVPHVMDCSWKPSVNQTTSTRCHKSPSPRVSHFSEASSAFSANSSSSSSGTYISLMHFSETPTQTNMMQGSNLAIIDENDTEQVEGESPGRSEHAQVQTDAGRNTEMEPCVSSNVSTIFSKKSSTLMFSTVEGSVPSGTPLPPSIVKTSVDTEGGKVIIQPICARWYTFLRLVSLCEVDEVNREGYVLLHTAAFNGEVNVVQYLVDSGADLAVLTLQGNTALTKAVDRNQVAVVSYLLEEGSRALQQSSTDPAAAQNSSRDLSWMMGTRSVYDIFSKIVQKRRGQMLCLLFSYGLRPREGDMEDLLREAMSVDNNDFVVRFLKEHRNVTANDEGDAEGPVYSVPESFDPNGRPEERDMLNAEGRKKCSKGIRYFLGL